MGIDFARFIGSFVCFQWEYVTFKIGKYYLPVGSGCLGIYLGAVFGFNVLPRMERLSRKLYSVPYGLPLILPQLAYWIILNVETIVGWWPIPGIKEVYFATGLIFGFEVSNLAYGLLTNDKDVFGTITTFTSRLFPFASFLALFLLLALLPFYYVTTAVVFTTSLFFLLGLSMLLLFGFLITLKSIYSYKRFSETLDEKSSYPTNKFSSVLEILVILTTFELFQFFFLETEWVLMFISIFSGITCFLLLSVTVHELSLKEMGLVSQGWKRHLFFGGLIGFVLYLIFNLYKLISNPAYQWNFIGTKVNLVTVLVIIAIIASEEFFFRGYIFPRLEKISNTYASVVVCSVLFGLYHQAAIFRFLLGIPPERLFMFGEVVLVNFLGSLILSYFFAKTRSLLMPIAIHGVWDVLIYGSMGVPAWVFP